MISARRLAVTSLVLALAAATGFGEDTGLSTALAEAIHQEEAVGDLDKAIEIYGKLLQQAQARRAQLAHATFRLGSCYLKKGQKEEAAKYLRQVTDHYPEQTALVTKAHELLLNLPPFDELQLLPEEVYRYLAEQHAAAGELARREGITRDNAHVYGVDEDFKLYWGGMTWLRNQLVDRPFDGPIYQGNTSFEKLRYFDEEGRPVKAHMAPMEGGPAKFRIFITPSKALAPGEIRMMSWIREGTTTLPKDESGAAKLTMQNHYGSEVLESFFLVVPSSLSIKTKSAEFKSHKRVGIFDIYLWQDRVPAGENHVVNVTLVRAGAAPEQQ